MEFTNPCPRLVLAGLSGGSGKTIVSLGVCRAAVDAGISVRPFKKGPDYIDAHWLALASRASVSNLDPFLFSANRIQGLFHARMSGYDLAIIEGNRGLFDGKDVDGSCSTAELAKVLKAPVVMVVDCTKVTRTMAAIVLGCQMFDPDLDLKGIILNRIAGNRHEAIVRATVERYTDLKVFGSLPKMVKNPIPERHMGLISDQEFSQTDRAFTQLSSFVREHLDLDALLSIADTAHPVPPANKPLFPPAVTDSGSVTIGYIHDASLWFYYQENLEALEKAGAHLVALSLLDATPWPEVHGLYLGGGFPETMAQRLSANTVMLERVRTLSRMGMPIYAECGGFMYLCRDLEYQGQVYPMAGIFPVSTTFCPKPQGLGYVQGRVTMPNPFYPVGTTLVGHEFHYSRSVAEGSRELVPCLDLERGQGVFTHSDLLLSNNTLAGYTHMHALSHPQWASRFVAAAKAYRGYHDRSCLPCPHIRI
ncbi:cobyrinate a,c-diamide synthase [Desulfoplanes formicivorans]|uniref:Cobyrinate a,c-diamide synthase n=1 Tax=Desulfoplanes formicivorans TaxID=1592317 RepID=A0A194AG44_9BACT|nr:cobyrinate a,c-diamide synthase [Desulfoplanes formicivorans]GAU08056.1 cobyrinic acid a,c-diamide synthase [Desulfoplanes formicivorans]